MMIPSIFFLLVVCLFVTGSNAKQQDTSPFLFGVRPTTSFKDEQSFQDEQTAYELFERRKLADDEDENDEGDMEDRRVTAAPTAWCYWNNLYWIELPYRVQLALGVLGETHCTWDECPPDIGCPLDCQADDVPIWFLKWSEITDEQRDAARFLGFTLKTWNDVILNDGGYREWHCDDFGETFVPNYYEEPCLSAYSQVQVLGRHEPTLLQDVQQGDSVLVDNDKNTYQTIYAFGHVDVYAVANFLQITTTSNNQQGPLEISGEHLLLKQTSSGVDAVPVRADSLQVGDVLVGRSSGDDAVITSITSIQRPGLYSPVTNDGMLMVNGLKVSSYTAAQDQHPSSFMVGETWQAISHHLMNHAAMAPVRFLCSGRSSSLELCKARNVRGQLLFAAAGEQVVVHQNAVLSLLLLSITLPLYFLEQLLLGKIMIMTVVVGLMVIIVAPFLSWRKKEMLC